MKIDVWFIHFLIVVGLASKCKFKRFQSKQFEIRSLRVGAPWKMYLSQIYSYLIYDSNWGNNPYTLSDHFIRHVHQLVNANI